MDKMQVLDYLKKQPQPEALGDIATALNLEHDEAARLLQQLSRENLAFRSVKDGHAYYSANSADGEGAIPTQTFIDGIQNKMQNMFGNGIKAQTVAGNSGTDVLLSVDKGDTGDDAEAQDSDMSNIADLLNGIRDSLAGSELPPESPANWTFKKGLKFENEQYSIPIPDGFKFVDCANRAFSAAPEASEVLSEDDLAEAEIQILDGKLMGGAIEHPVLADADFYEALMGHMGYVQAEQMRGMEKGPLAALTNDVRLKLRGDCCVVSVQTGTGYSYMAQKMTCDGVKMLRVQTNHTPRSEAERELEVLVDWISRLNWKHVMPRQPLDDPALTKDANAWLDAAGKKVNQLQSYRQMVIGNEVSRRESKFDDEEDFKSAMCQVAKTMEPAFERVFAEMVNALQVIEGLDVKEGREFVDSVKGFYPINIGSNSTKDLLIEGSDRICASLAEMEACIAQKERAIREKEEAERKAREQREAEKKKEEERIWAEKYAKRQAEEKAKKEAAEADAKRRAALEQADLEQYNTFMAKYNEAKEAYRKEAQEHSRRLESRRQELSRMGLFSFSAKKAARADIERMETEQRTLPDRQKEQLKSLWKDCDNNAKQGILNYLVLQYIKAHEGYSAQAICRPGLSGTEFTIIDISQVNAALARLEERGQIVGIVEKGEKKYRAVKDGETAASVRIAAQEEADKAAQSEQKTQRTVTRTQNENELIKTEIMAFLSSGAHKTVSELKAEMSTLAGLDTQRVSAIMRLLKLEGKVDKEVVKGRTLFYSVDNRGSYTSGTRNTTSYAASSRITPSYTRPTTTTPSYSQLSVTNTAKANEEMKALILNCLSCNGHMTALEIIENVPELRGENVQKVNALLRLLKLEGKVEKEVIKGKTYFFLT